jgi:hypothetical protein
VATRRHADAAALVRARFPTLVLEALRRRLLASADRPEALAGVVVSGRLNANGALVGDGVPPGMPRDLTATHHGETALRLAWTASGDDGNNGAAADFDLRYSTAPITNANFNQARRAPTPPRPGPSGTPHGYLLTDLLPDTAYYVALRALDKVGNLSTLAALGPVRTLAASQECVFEDDAESAPKFSGPHPWAVTTEDSFSGTRSYTDSPGGKYANNLDISLTQNSPVTVTGSAPLLTFWAKTDLEERFDNLFVEASSDNRVWHRLLTLNGTSDWSRRTAPLLAFRGQSVRIRFRLVSDADVSRNGVWLDDIRICSRESDLLLFQDTAEGPPQFSGPQPWAVSSERSFSRPNGYTDSPGRKYGNNLDLSLTQNASVTLASLAPELTFWAQTELEEAYDFLYVEISETDGASWRRLGSLNGFRQATFYRYSLADYFGRSVRIRFRLVTDVDTTFDGVWLDDIRIGGERLFLLPGVTAPAAPSELTARAAGSRVELAWKINSNNETGFRIERRTGSGAFAEAGTVGAGVRSFSDTSALPLTTYTYRVRAINLAGESAPSPNATVTTEGSGRLRVAGALDFGGVKVKKKRKRNLVLRNASANEVLRVTINPPGGQYRIAAGGGTATIPPSGQHVVRVVFRPTRRGRAAGRLVIGSSDRSLTSTGVRLTGRGR